MHSFADGKLYNPRFERQLLKFAFPGCVVGKTRKTVIIMDVIKKDNLAASCFKQKVENLSDLLPNGSFSYLFSFLFSNLPAVAHVHCCANLEIHFQKSFLSAASPHKNIMTSVMLPILSKLS